MSPQFVDFDADGHLDIVAGTFSGSPWLARGSASGFTPPEQILDAKGERILLNQFWNYDAKKWDATNRCDAPAGKLAQGHGTSAFAFDWDADGDLDLILGDYDGGQLYLRINEGKAGAPAFAGVNAPILAGGKPLQVGKVATPRMVDWDGDGLLDLLVGSFGDASGQGAGGSVHVYRNRGSRGAPEFAAPDVLVAPRPKGATEPQRPATGLYPDLADVDGDGDLDLVVGGYAQWTPAARTLSTEEVARVAELQAEIKKIAAEQTALTADLTEAVRGLDREAAAKKRAEILAERRPGMTDLAKRRQDLQKQLDPLVPGPKRVSFVWLYVNTGGKQVAAPARPRGA